MVRQITLILIIAGLFTAVWSGNSFHFAVLSDRTGGADQAAYETVVKDIKNLYPDLVVTVGDIIEDGIYEDWPNALTPLEALECPIYFAAGNNDIIDAATEDNFREKTGHEPYYSFDHENCHFIILDNSRISSYEEMEDQILWLKEDLELNRLAENIFLLMHKPFWAESISRNEPDRLHEILVGYNVKAVFTGHWHHYAYESIDNIDYYICGSSGGTTGDVWNDDLAEFYQFLWCYVEDEQVKVTLMKSGSTFPVDIRNLEELDFYSKIPQNYLATECRITDQSLNRQEFSLTIQNQTDEVIDEPFEIISENWITDNALNHVTISPGDTLTYTLSLEPSISELPLPMLKFNYPFGREKHYPYLKPIQINRSMKSYPLQVIPKIDGEIEPSAWQGTETDKLLVDNKGSRMEFETLISCMYDKNYIYLAAVCKVGDIEKIKAEGDEQTYGIFGDDHLGLLLTSDGNKYIQLYINAAGNCYFNAVQRDNNESDQQLPSDCLAAAAINDDSWSVEIKFPRVQLNDETGSEINLNIRRYSSSNSLEHYLIPEWSYRSVQNGILTLEK